MAQFSLDDGGYLLVAIQNILYIFDNNKELKKNYNLTEEINADQYQIIPYKNDNNILNFFISYIYSLQLILSIFQFDLNNLESDFIINKKYYTPVNDNGYLNAINGLSCTFISNSSSGINTILTCFLGIIYPSKLYSTSIDLEDNFTEIESLRAYQDIGEQQISYVISATDENKQKAIILITTFSHVLYSVTFDFVNKFSNPVNEILGTNVITISSVYHDHKLIFFKQTDEFVMSSSLSGCDKLIIVYHKNFTLNYKGVLNINEINEGCSFSFSFSLFYDGNNYTILTDGLKSSSLFKSVENDFEIFAKVNSNIETNNPIDITEFQSFNTFNLKTDELSNLITNLRTDSQTVINEIKTDITKIPNSYIETDSHTDAIKTDIPTIPNSYIEVDSQTIMSVIKTSTPTIPTSYIEADVLTENKDKMAETTYLIENFEENALGNIKCKTSTSESAFYNFCTSCNNKKDYFPAQFPKEEFLNGFIECYNNFTKPINFYFDISDKKYKACYETCETCIEGGNGIENKCLTCDFNHRKKEGNRFPKIFPHYL